MTAKKGDFCFDHIKQCKQLQKQKNKSCDEIWDKKCTSDMSLNELVALNQRFDDCVHIRKTYAKNCVMSGCKDRGHKGAQTKMKNRALKCQNILKSSG